MDIKYKFEQGQNKLIICNLDTEKEDYKYQMLFRNNIEGLVSVKLNVIDTHSELVYQITAMQSLKSKLTSKVLTEATVVSILSQIINTTANIKEYMLREEDLLLAPEYIYIERNGAVKLCAVPNHNMQYSIKQLIEYIMDTVGETMFYTSYKLYKFLKLDNCVMEALGQMLKDGTNTVVKDDTRVKIEAMIDDAKTILTTKASETASKVQVPIPIETYEYTYEKEESSFEMDNDREKANSDRRKTISAVMGAVGLIGIMLINFCGAFSIVQAMIMSGVILSVFGFLIYKQMTRAESEVETEEQAEVEPIEYDKYVSRLFEEPVSDTKAQTNTLQTKKAPTTLEQEEEKTVYMKIDTNGAKMIRMDSNTIHNINVFPYYVGKQRERVNLYLEEERVSRLHALITKEEGDYYIKDLNSTNGTFINGERLQLEESRRLKKDDEIMFAGLCFRFNG